MIFLTEHNEEELKKLAKSIEKTAIHAPSRRRKSKMKKRLLLAIDENSEMKQYANLVGGVRKLAEGVHFPKNNKSNVRQSILHYISLDLGSFSWTQVCKNGIFNRTAWAISMIFVMSFVSIFAFQFNSPISYAKDSVLHNIEGDVYVYRGGMLTPAVDGFVLEQDDKIHTGYNSSVTAIFMDNTVSRISGDSKLNVDVLYSDDLNPNKSTVTLGVAEGRIWSNVLSSAGSNFNVATLHTVVKVDRSATFDVYVTDEKSVEISVIENFVDVELSSYSPSVETTVVEGESLIVNGKDNTIIALNDKDEWLRMNVSKDEFESKLIAQQGAEDLENVVGALPNDKMYGVKIFRENLGVVLSVSDREKIANQLAIAKKRLAETDLLIQKGMSGTAEKVLQEYKQTMLTLTQKYPDLIGISDVQEQLNSMIAWDKRRYYTTLPGSSLYKVKKVVEEVEFLLANDRIRANQIALNQSSDSLYQIFNLLEHGGEIVAEDSIKNYVSVLDTTLLNLVVYDQDDQEEYLKATFDVALKDLKTLNALENVLSDDSSLNISLVKDNVISTLESYISLVNKDGDFDEFASQLEALQVKDIDELVELNDSEFVGASDENAATINMEIEESQEQNGVDATSDSVDIEGNV